MGGAGDQPVARPRTHDPDGSPALVVLAAGRGRRFGGPKQVAPVGPAGETITEVLLGRAQAAGFGRAVVVTRRDLVAPFNARFGAQRPAIDVELVVQGEPTGTVDAVLAAQSSVSGDFAVVNADDLYPFAAFTLVVEHLHSLPASAHALVAFPVARTLVGDAPVSRALLDVDADGRLHAIRETVVGRDGDALWAEHDGERSPIDAGTWVSMNMYGFRHGIFDALARVAAARTGRAGELRLPDAIDTLVRANTDVRVLRCDADCLGLTYESDLAAVEGAVSRPAGRCMP